jgi:hypothetical protein
VIEPERKSDAVKPVVEFAIQGLKADVFPELMEYTAGAGEVRFLSSIDSV